MKANIGLIDKVFRILVASVIAILYFTNQITGATALILGVLALIFILTSLIGTCPIYLALGISSKKKEK